MLINALPRHRAERRARRTPRAGMRVPRRSLMLYAVLLNLMAWVLFVAGCNHDLLVGTLAAPLHLYVVTRWLIVAARGR